MDQSVVTHWTFPVAHDEYIVKSRIGETAYGLCGAATIVGGFVFILGRTWGMYCHVTGAAVLILFGQLARPVAAKPYPMNGPGLDDLFFACCLAKLASLAFAVRPRRLNEVADQ
jgi:hypothetical protein